MNQDLENCQLSRPKSSSFVQGDYQYSNNRNLTNLQTKPIYYYQSPSWKKPLNMRSTKLKADSVSSYQTCQIIETQDGYTHTPPPEIKRQAFLPTHNKKINIKQRLKK